MEKKFAMPENLCERTWIYIKNYSIRKCKNSVET